MHTADHTQTLTDADLDALVDRLAPLLPSIVAQGIALHRARETAGGDGEGSGAPVTAAAPPRRLRVPGRSQVPRDSGPFQPALTDQVAAAGR